VIITGKTDTIETGRIFFPFFIFTAKNLAEIVI